MARIIFFYDIASSWRAVLSSIRGATCVDCKQWAQRRAQRLASRRLTQHQIGCVYSIYVRYDIQHIYINTYIPRSVEKHGPLERMLINDIPRYRQRERVVITTGKRAAYVGAMINGVHMCVCVWTEFRFGVYLGGSDLCLPLPPAEYAH